MPVFIKSKSGENTPLTRANSADFLTGAGFPCSAKSLSNLAVQGAGPTFRKWGKRCLYNPADLLAWAEKQLGEPTTLSRRTPADATAATGTST